MCPNLVFCAMCTGSHITKACPREKVALQYCINCTEASENKERETNPSFDKKDVESKDMAALTHSVQASNYPILQAKAVPSQGRDYFLSQGTTPHPVPSVNTTDAGKPRDPLRILHPNVHRSQNVMTSLFNASGTRDFYFLLI